VTSGLVNPPEPGKTKTTRHENSKQRQEKYGSNGKEEQKGGKERTKKENEQRTHRHNSKNGQQRIGKEGIGGRKRKEERKKRQQHDRKGKGREARNKNDRKGNLEP
jgi:hypothetical protein